MLNFFTSIFQSANQRRLNDYQKIVSNITVKEHEIANLPEEKFKSLFFEEDADNIKIVEVFAAVREAAKRTIGLRHFDCQLVGGLVLNGGNIAEMKTGEGKTLVATLPAVLNALNHKKVYVVTVNDYLAERDAEWMRPVYEYFGLSVGFLTSSQSFQDKQATYDCNIIYCTSSELGFDYLRDNMVLFKNQKSQKDLNFAIIDEVDSILIDEARTPLIISGATDDDASAYPIFLKLLPQLKRQMREGTEEEPLTDAEKGDFLIDEKIRSVDLTDSGFEKVENFLADRGMIKTDESLYTTNNLKFLKYIQATLKANLLFEKNVHYVVESGKVVLIDDNTGRKLPGRRISDGVHQALECKEKVGIQQETQTLASTTYQNFFRLFDKISGMTGTADTEAAEFKQIYNMDVVVIPTNQPMVRNDVNDVVYVNEEDKFQALIKEIKSIHDKKAPILVGTASIESSEKLSKRLKKEGIRHQVLNAKYHEKEAGIIAEAGRPGAITIATNMAGRGTDIVLGGRNDNDQDWQQKHQEVLNAGGLHVIGTERHESRRIDNQLRGRSGRQGDPGYSKFFLSLDDTVLRLFIDENRKQLFSRLSDGMDDSSIEHPLLNGAIANAQKKIEGRNFEIRKQILEFDDVSNDQRLTVYELRNYYLDENDPSDLIKEYIDNFLEKTTDKMLPEDQAGNWNFDELANSLQASLTIAPDFKNLDKANMSFGKVMDFLNEFYLNFYHDKFEKLGNKKQELERQIAIQVLDACWKRHLQNVDSLRANIGLRAYAQRNPINEFKRESFEMFDAMIESFKDDSVRILFNIKIQTMSKQEFEQQKQQRLQQNQNQKLNS
ncbi:MAG: preprotein translocase subunit SecA [Proteobacteria bacterium]|nr:preprotein translocase subunit SecA [Pseudomonadota bacterium]MDA0899516.1 preprotein translocase subunit SecA [Pseudomonadota bacterium]MDA1056276.1 preprotein translocase subunit SecA [Pseudomonadota bacterium]